ncbi:MAG: hypothetical protein HY273_00355 [Gammaproteobacteria bacterium]|nr:hypothetical protein [Gammaproteobacteria bacterium]
MNLPQNTLRLQLLGLCLAVVVLAAACIAIRQATPPQPWVGAWLTPWDFANGAAALERDLDVYTDVYYFWAQLTPAGAPVFGEATADSAGLLTRLHQRKVRTWLTVVNDVIQSGGNAQQLKDAAIISRMLNDAQARQAHRAQIVRMTQVHGFDGVDIDYENLFAADREPFTRFIGELADELHTLGLRLSVTVEPKSTQNRGAADWSGLCAAADRVQVMLYNQHSGKTGPGPIATPEWMGHILTYAETQCAREKIVPVLKAIGAGWSDVKVRGVTYSQAQALRGGASAPVERGPDDLVPHFVTTVDNVRTTVYYEDAISIGAKLKLLRQRGYRSTILWNLGAYDPAIAIQLREYLR